MTRSDEDATLKAADHPIFAPESAPWNLFPTRRAECQVCRDYTDDLLGPHPEQTVETLRDLGLSDHEIAKYFRISLLRIKRLSDGGKRSDGPGSLREFAKLMRAKLFGGTIL